MIRFATSRLSSRTVGQEPFRLRQLALPAMLLLAIGGLAMQAFEGERGWRGWMDLQTVHADRQNELQALQQSNENLQQRIVRLGNDRLDLDFLDERARLVLGLTGKDEKVIISN